MDFKDLSRFHEAPWCWKKFLESMQELREKVCCYELYDYRFCWIIIFVA